MKSKKQEGIGEKVLGWFIVRDAGENENEEEREDAHEAAPAREDAPVRTRAPARDATAFGGVYPGAEVPEEDRERLEKVRALIESLPAGAAMEDKRAIVAASLEAFGVSIDRILVSGQGAMAALDGHVADGEQRTREVLAQAEATIAKLTAEIEEVRRLMGVQVAAQQELVRKAGAEKARVRAVLDFFGPRDRGIDSGQMARVVRLR
jgi:hypothetical protein